MVALLSPSKSSPNDSDSPEPQHIERWRRTPSRSSASDDAYLYRQMLSIGWSADGSRLTVAIENDLDIRLSPNRRKKWDKINATTELRNAIRMTTMSLLNSRAIARKPNDVLYLGDVRVKATVYWGPHRKYWDNTNVMIALKPVFDGLEDAGVLLNDRQIKKLEVDQRRSPHRHGNLVIEVTPL